MEEKTGSIGRVNERPTAGKMIDRGTVERNQRDHMRGLCNELFSLLAPRHFTTSKEMLSLQSQIDEAASYIKQLRRRVEELRVRKEQAAITTSIVAGDHNNDNGDCQMMEQDSDELRVPILELKEVFMGSGLQVNLISKSSSNKSDNNRSNFFSVSCKLIGVLQDEGAEVVDVSFVHRGSKVFYSIHAQVKILRIGIETSRIIILEESMKTLRIHEK
ncbi:hypothetical protein CRG98_020510 [Punica granatum]|uniref:BHLH domain-containing protein n=1 Tax=Punica granatum TaxID=22663 RepID=A0A2I0JS66_PUNGR|nr:hypothetical protein CRG98_020510 [Punica granatum]